MKYIFLCSSDNVLSVKGGGNAWTILKLLEKFYEQENNGLLMVVGIFADAVIFDKESLKIIDECMNKKTEAYLERGELPFKRGLGVVLSKRILKPHNIVYRFLAPAYYLLLSVRRNLRAKDNLDNFINKLNIGDSDAIVLDCHDPFSAYFMNKVKFPCRKISVVHSHEIGSQALNLIRVRKGVNFVIKKVNLFIEKRGYEACGFASFPSRGAMKTLLDDRPDLTNVLNSKEVEILYTGIKTNFSKEDNDHLVGEKDKIRFLFVGRLVDEKGFDLVLEAIKVLKGEGKNISLDVVGFGDLSPINKFVSDNKLEDVIFLRGVLSHDEVLKFMLISDVLVAPHRKSVFDLVMLEAMHIGLPIVSTSVGGNIELIKSENEGILVESDNLDQLVGGMRLMIENESLRVNIAKNARMYALDFFSEEAMFERYEKFFNKILV